MRPAIFLDRDKTINKDLGYNPQLKIYDDVVPFFDGVAILDPHNEIKKVIISNQSGVGRGYIKEEDVKDFNRNLAWLLMTRASHILINGFYYCPHTPDDRCACRKPLPGLIYKAAIELDIDLERSVMIGDKMADYETGKAAGIESILVDRDGGFTGYKENIRIVKSLEDAVPIVKWLLNL